MTNHATTPRKVHRTSFKNLSELARQISATIGAEFFESLVKSVGNSLNADCTYIGEFVGGQLERVKTLAGFIAEGRSCDDDYVLVGTAAAQVATGDAWSCPRSVLKKIPEDVLLANTGAQACVAVPLVDGKRRVLGVMLVAFRHVLGDSRLVKSTLEMFAPRASAELQRKQADEALRESEQRYHAFIAQNADAMWRIEFDVPISTNLPEDEQIAQIFSRGYLAECNDAMARLLGRDKAEQLIGASFQELAGHADPNLREDLRTAIRSGYRFDTVETKPLDQEGYPRHHLRSHWCIIENGKLNRIWGTIRDVTELKRTEENLQSAERRLDALLGSIRLLTVMLDSDGSIAYCNDHLLHLTGWQPSDLAGQNWFDLLVPPEERERLRAEFASGGANVSTPQQATSTLLGKHGRQWRIAWEQWPLYRAGKQPFGFGLLGHNITRLPEMQQEVNQFLELHNIKRALSKIANDIVNELTVITGYCSIAAQEPMAESLSGSLAAVHTAANEGMAIAQRLFALDRECRPEPKVVNLNHLIEEVGRMVESLLPDDVLLQIDLDPQLDMVRVDPDEFHKAFLTLAVNAIEAMPDGGRLTFHSTNIELNEARAAHVAEIAPGAYVLVSVADTGQGMSEEVKAHLFEPFYSTKSGHIGLGLSAVYGVVQKSDGHIVVDSSLDTGTDFQIYLPQAGTRATAAGD